MDRAMFIRKQRWDRTLFLLEQARKRFEFYPEGSKGRRKAASEIDILETRALADGLAVITK